MQAAAVRGALVLLVLGGAACGALRQNLRDQFLSYRGTWACPPGAAECELSEMTRSTQGHREGEVNVSHAPVDPKVALVFSPGTPVDSFAARVRCGEQTRDVAGGHVLAPSAHDRPGQAESWVVVLEDAAHGFPRGCGTRYVTAHATWEGGKREYEVTAGVAPR